ncbi:hypothetical protein [Wolbachia endosymbiont (group A) of Sympetrum striolatum]|uniref:hypothetical protein n=2 Tax=unclassified Wolbachia TaxID=2640676 RepID=UPI0022262A8E|nr:hypothetical protein [Wolbachia endosymbiont (group A) of Sympetrum striolatum]
MTIVRVSSQRPYDVIRVADTGVALLHRSSEKNWQLLTKFIINSHLTVEEKICHKK